MFGEWMSCARFGMVVKCVEKNAASGRLPRATASRGKHGNYGLGSTSASGTRSSQVFKGRSAVVARPLIGTTSNRSEHVIDVEGAMAIGS